MKRLILGSIFALSAAAANATLIGDVTDNGGGSYTISNGAGSVSDSALEAFAGLASGALDALPNVGNATEGSAIQGSGYIAAGETFQFDWLWTSDEVTGSSFNDTAFYVLGLVGYGVIANTFTADGATNTFSWFAPVAGYLTWSIGVIDVNDTIVDSFLTVSNIQPPALSVSEPLTLSLFGLGLLGLGAARRFRKGTI